jgi:hypothetical protein
MRAGYSKHSMIALIFCNVLSLIFIAGANAADWKGREIEKDGMRHILNPSLPMESDRTFITVTAWRVDGGADSEVLFGPIGGVARDADGNSYVLDYQLNTVHVISAEGEYIRSIGREGEGPGEFQDPSGIMALPNGTICVLQPMPARAVLLTADGLAAGDHPLPRGEDGVSPILNGGSVAAGQIFLYLAKPFRKEASAGLQTSFVLTDAEGGITTTYWELFQEFDFAKVTFDEKGDAPPVWAMGADGRFCINNNWDDYFIEVIGPDGDPEYVIEREYEHFSRTPRDFEYIEELKKSGTMVPATEVSKTHRDVAFLLPRENGELWVLPSRGERDIQQGTIGIFDVFNRQGRFVRQIIVKGPFTPGRDGFFFVGDFIYVVINNGEFGGEDLKDTAAKDNTNSGEISVLCLKLADVL